jgi:hypothetical protein
MTTLGRHPAGNDSGWGIVGVGDARGSILGSFTTNSWVTAAGGRAGTWPGDATATGQIAIYKATSSAISTIIGTMATFSAAVAMADNASGADYVTKPAVPIPVAANQIIAGILRGQNGRLTHGQDNSGYVMHKRYNVGTSFPSPFAASEAVPEGRMSIWVEATANRAPITPFGLSPKADSITIDATPDLAASFRDADETVGGATYGQADYLSAYSFEVWNDAGTAKLRSSGKLTATAAMKTDRRATWTVPTDLPAARYECRCILYDYFGTPSPQAKWKVTVSSGGLFQSPQLVPAAYVATDPDVTNSTTPGFQGTWTSTAGVNVRSVQARVLNEDGSIAQPQGTVDLSVGIAPGTVLNFTSSGWGWTALTPGRRYQIEFKGMDANGQDSPWVRTPLFLVNAPPNVPTNRSPTAGRSFTTRPTLSATLSDPNHDASQLTPDYRVRPAGNTGVGVNVPATYLADGVWPAPVTVAAMPALGNFEWSVAATDPYGLAGPRSTWLAVNWVTAPTVTVVSPTNGATITTGTPTIGATVNRTITSYQIQLFDLAAVNGVLPLVYDSKTVVSNAIGLLVPAGKLRNTRSYRLLLTVTTSDGLVTVTVTTFTLTYPAQPALANVTATKQAAQFEPASDPGSWSTIAVSWTAPTTTAIPDLEFGGYLIRRKSLATGVEEAVAHLATRGETVWVDRTPRSGELYAYTPVALRLLNTVDWVESTPISPQALVRLKYTVISELRVDGLSLPLRSWSQRTNTPTRDVELIPTLSGKPVSFQGIGDADVIAGSFDVLDWPEVAATARDQVTVAEELGRPDFDELDRPVPKDLCYRDPKRRVLFVAMTGYREEDEHTGALVRLGLEFSETAARLTVGEVTP